MYPKALPNLCCTIIFVFLSYSLGLGQSLFPVKKGKLWGLINADGVMCVRPQYDAIGNFEQLGYATMQRAGKVGLLNQSGEEIITPQFEDIRVLDTQLVAVMRSGDWEVQNLAGQIILSGGYDQLEIWPGGFLGFARNDKWGVVDYNGNQILSPKYEQIVFQTSDSCFYLQQAEKIGLANQQGEVFVQPYADALRLLPERGYLFQLDNKWGLMDLACRKIISADYQTFEEESEHYLKLYKLNQVHIYSWLCQQLIYAEDFSDYFALSPRFLVTVQNEKVRLLNWCGQSILSDLYDEILWFDQESFRVRSGTSWQIRSTDDSVLTTRLYDYIAPLHGRGALVQSKGKYGLINAKGSLVIPTTFANLDWNGEKAVAYQDEKSLSKERAQVFYLDKNGNHAGDQVLSKHFTVQIKGEGQSAQGVRLSAKIGIHDISGTYEWYYDSGADRWGLRDRTSGQIKISPSFRVVKPIPNTTLTLVSLASKSPLEFERTSFRFDQIFGLVNHQ
ncbi:MAG: WG repeat-containing protein [Saprospiraceae bacterium]|nr:WG repeat-containing protein [Saprospiraceae bacterium]